MKKIKKIAIAGLCCFAAVAGGVLLQNDATSVSAEGTFTSVHDVEGHFYMDNGAAVRLNEGSSGIRFETYVSQDWYNYASNNGEKTVTFYTSIDKDGNTDSGEAKIVLAQETLAFDEETNLYRFTGAIVYNNLDEATDAVKVEAHNMQLEGKAYAVIDDGTTQTTVWADTDDNVRSMAEVADSTIKLEGTEVDGKVIDKYKPSEETVLKSYYTSKKKTMYVENTGATLDVTPEFAGAKVLKVAMKDQGDTYNAGALTFNDDVATATAASDAYATVYTDKGIVETNFKVCTAVITDIADFKSAVTPDNPTGDITGYYYLANDIGSKTDYPSITPAWRVSSSTAFAGVFDGAGHEMNVTLGAATGLFRYLENATVQNVRFNIRANNASQGYGLAQYVFGECYFTDMYLNLESVSATCTQAAPLSRYYYGQSHFIRVVIETPTAEELSGFTDQSKFAALAVSYNYLNADGKEKGDVQSWRIDTDVYVISSLPLATYGGLDEFKIEVKAHNQTTVISSTTTYFGQYEAENRGRLYAYTSFAELKTDATAPDENTAAKIDLTKYTNTKYWTTDTNGYLTWEGNN